MSEDKNPRRPRVFRADERGVSIDEAAEASTASGAGDEPGAATEATIPVVSDLSAGLRWGAIFVAAIAGLAVLSFGAWMSALTYELLQRQDWAGWTALGLLAIAGIAAARLIFGELAGLIRLGRMRRIKDEVAAALAEDDGRRAARALRMLRRRLDGRPELAGALGRFAIHDADIMTGRERLALADRELMAPLDGQARSMIARSSKHVAMVTAVSPTALIDVLYVIYENLRMMRRVAALYGGRPGMLGLLRLGRMVITHIIVTGGLALTDDLLPQAIGQGLAARLSFRLGQGLFNGSLTARIGCAAIAVIRPLPHLETRPPRYRELAAEVATTLRSSAKVSPRPET